MLDAIQAANATEPVAFAGQTYPVRQLSFAEWAELHGWLRFSTPNPVKVAAEAVAAAAQSGKPLPPAVVDALYSHAQREARAWPPPVGTTAWLAALDGTAEGAGRFVQKALAGGGTAVSLEDAVRLAEQATGPEMAELLRVAYWGGPATAPKATTGTTTTAASPTGAPSSPD